MTTTIYKQNLRRLMQSRRKSLPPAEVSALSASIVQKFLASEFYQNAAAVMAYVSMPFEVQLREIFVDALANKKTLAVPLIVGKGDMTPVIVPDFESLEVGDFGIPTVRADSRIFIGAQKIDCVIVPGAAFDVHGNRLGLGGGFYDKFLPTTNAAKIALAFDFQLVDAVPAELHDSPVDIIITENRIITAERS